jgi:hypothetical protein
MKKMRQRCPVCKAVQRIEHSPIMSRTLRCHKCGARFVVGLSRRNGKVGPKQSLQSSLISCKDCGKEISGRAERCPNCGAPTPGIRIHKQRKWPKIAAVSLSAAVILVVVGLGFVHIITGSSLSAPHIVRKGTFGYSETFINIDRITGMPWVFAKSKYPVGCRVLQDKGHIESDEAFERRVSSNYGSNTLAKSFTPR